MQKNERFKYSRHLYIERRGVMMSDKKVLVIASSFIALGLFSLLFLLPVVYAIDPFGANVTVTNITRAPADTADSEFAYAGNISEMTVTGYSITQSWQGYYGNVTGTIQLADGSDYVMYNWSAASPLGEIYASTNQTISWVNIQCFNYTATGQYTGETGNGGTTSLYGTNLSILEGMYGINATDVDGVDETFTYLGDHNLFYTANKQFSVGECRSTRVYADTGPEADNYEEVLLYEPATTSVIFTSILERDEAGFNTKSSDFEMLVLENGHGTDVSATTYYFFVELE
jgi:hypothetical protein